MNYQKNFKKQVLPALISVCMLPLYANVAVGATILEEVVVTARKRQESIQDVPVAVSAITPGQLERGSVQNVLDVAKLVPNVELHQVAQGSHALGASIRGMSFDDLEKSFEPTVGISVDGVFLASSGGAVIDFFDIEAVEVLRGPQGTLYGRNTIAGVINVTRSAPTGEWGAKIQADFGQDSKQDFKAILNMPLGDRGGVKLSLHDLTSDSFVYNTTRNERSEFRDSETATLAIKYDLTDKTTATLTLDTYDHKTTPPDILASGSTDNFFCGVLSLACDSGSGAISEASDYKNAVASQPMKAFIEGDNTTLHITHEEDSYTLKYIMGVMDFEEYVYLNSWGAPNPLVEVIRDQTYKQVSHELQYLSNYEGPFNFVAGLYYLKTDAFLTSGPGQTFTSVQDAEAQSLFGEMSYDLSDLWSVTLGARYTEEDKTLDLTRWVGDDRNADRLANNKTAGTTFKPTFSDDNVSYRAVLQRNIPTGMMYASVSTGFRSGGFVNRGSTTAEIGPYESEEVQSFELGIRSQPTDNSQINVTLFSTDYTDKQINAVTDGTVCGKLGSDTCTFVRNAASVTTEGVEIEAVLMPTDAIVLRSSFGYLDAGYDEYQYQGTDIANKAKILYAPKITANLTAEHTSEVAGGELTVSGSLSYKDDVYGFAAFETYNFATGPDISIEGHEAFDLSATFTKDTSNGTMKLSLYGTDLLESGNRVSRAYDAGAFAWEELVPRRRIGLKIGYDF